MTRCRATIALISVVTLVGCVAAVACTEESWAGDVIRSVLPFEVSLARVSYADLEAFIDTEEMSPRYVTGDFAGRYARGYSADDVRALRGDPRFAVVTVQGMLWFRESLWGPTRRGVTSAARIDRWGVWENTFPPDAAELPHAQEILAVAISGLRADLPRTWKLKPVGLDTEAISPVTWETSRVSAEWMHWPGVVLNAITVGSLVCFLGMFWPLRRSDRNDVRTHAGI